MRHRKGNAKLSKPTDQRIALLRSLVESLFTHSRIKTTDVRSKEAKKVAEKIITLAKKGDLHARRQALKILPRKTLVKDIFTNIAKNYEQTKGGYTRIVKLGYRKGDGAPISLLELVQ